jgi:hypothetical protein
MTTKKKQRNNHKQVKNSDDATTKNAASTATSAAKQQSSYSVAAVTTSGQQQQQQPASAPRNGILSPGQLAALILLTLGISRLMQVKSALRMIRHVHNVEESAESNDQNNSIITAAAPICLDYILRLPQVVCVDNVVNTWLHFKYMTGLQVLLTTCGMWIRGGCWCNEDLLKAFNAVLVLTPIVTTAFCFLIQLDKNNNGVLNERHIWKQSIMCVVLSLVAMPGAPSQLPFFINNTSTTSSTKTRSSYKTVSSLMLMTLFCMQMLQVLAGLGLVDRNSNSNSSSSSSSWFPQLPSKTIVETGSSSSDEDKAVASTVWIIHSFWLVDMFTLSAIYFFAWFHLSPGDQKVRKCDQKHVAVMAYVGGGDLATILMNTFCLSVVFYCTPVFSPHGCNGETLGELRSMACVDGVSKECRRRRR